MADREPGDVFHYPYLWAHDHAKGIDNPKDRTACLVFQTKTNPGVTQLVILAISDQAPVDSEDAIEVPEIELRRGGLNFARRAFVHVSEYNLDTLPFSTSYDPNSRSFGRFSRSFTERVARLLANNIRTRRARRMTR
ncbi:hypothetical protein ACMDCR_15575 [Labrys okinawensis]|uniref:hypothetical protein n=1 Tax=Labrys okinawensis TaxID=346911 RepID=UPI0039BCD1E1